MLIIALIVNYKNKIIKEEKYLLIKRYITDNFLLVDYYMCASYV